MRQIADKQGHIFVDFFMLNAICSEKFSMQGRKKGKNIFDMRQQLLDV